MPPAGFEPTISVDELPQTYALDRAATGTGNCLYIQGLNLSQNIVFLFPVELVSGPLSGVQVNADRKWQLIVVR